MEGKKLFIAGILILSLAAVVVAAVVFASAFLNQGTGQDAAQSPDTTDMQTPDMIAPQASGDTGEQAPDSSAGDTLADAGENSSAVVPDDSQLPASDQGQVTTSDGQADQVQEETVQTETAADSAQTGPAPDDQSTQVQEQPSEDTSDQLTPETIAAMEDEAAGNTPGAASEDTSTAMQDGNVPPGPADSIDGPFLMHGFLNQTDGKCLVSLQLQPEAAAISTEGLYIDILCDGQVYSKVWTPHLVDWCNSNGDTLLEQGEILATVIDTAAKGIPQGKPMTIQVMKDGTGLQDVAVAPS